MKPNPFESLLHSRKFWLAVFAGLLGFALCLLGKLPVEHVAGFVGALTLVLIHSIAQEDVATKTTQEPPQ